jgi:hypothetical protein
MASATEIRLEDPAAKIEASVSARRNLTELSIYGLALTASIALWFVAFRAPLWLDETGSYWLIREGFWKIASRQGDLSFPAYSYILWAFTKILGTSEIALRIPSVLAMLAATYLLYRSARELFDRDVAFMATMLFAIHPITIYAAIDVRPYAFGALAINAAIYLLLRLRKQPTPATAMLFGIAAACIVYFHFLFAVILPVLFVRLLSLGAPRLALETWEYSASSSVKSTLAEKKIAPNSWTFIVVALGTFTLAFLPVIPGLLAMFRTRGTHVFELAPQLRDLYWTFAPGKTIYVVTAAILLAAALRRFNLERRVQIWNLLLCLGLGVVPILILYIVSVATPLHLFTERHRLVAIPGIALCWAFLLSRIDARWIRVAVCAILVGLTAFHNFRDPAYRQHGYTWKYALAIADQNAAPDHAPLLICSDLPESDYAHMPLADAKNSRLFIQLSYYTVNAPVIPLPRSLNDETRRVTSRFLLDAAPRHQRFLALAFGPSWNTLQYLTTTTATAYDARVIGQSDGIAIVEFLPRSGQP